MRLRAAAIGTAALAGAFLALASGQQVHRNGFEAHDTAWVRGPADASFRETAHRLTEDTSHSGQRCEHLQLQAETGTYAYYVYDVGRAPLGEELTASVWVKANRPGIQFVARLVLPRERHPDRPEEPLTTLLRGDFYQSTSRFQRLALNAPLKLARQQQQLLRAELKRDINLQDAYVDRLMLNVYAGPGQTDVWIDDVEIGPVLEPVAPKTVGRPAGRDGDPAPARAASVRLEGSRLQVGGRRFFLRAIRHTDTPFKALRDAGFNTVWLDETTPAAKVEEAVKLGFWIVPAIGLAENDPRFVSAETLAPTLSRFLHHNAVLCWELGDGGLAKEQSAAVERAARAVRAVDVERPLAADVWDGFDRYSGILRDGLLGVHRWPLMTGLELPQYREWLKQRRDLTQPGTFLWTWVQTHLPDWYTQLVYRRPGTATFEEPIGPQAEQIRLVTYTALAAGCRGLGFWSDRFLADSHHGRDRLLTLALINQELHLLEPLLTTAETPSWIDTSSPHVKAAVFRAEKAVLLVPVWVGPGSQFVPPQAAVANLKVVVPQVPDAYQAWLVSPGDMRSLRSERVVGGRQVVVPEFDLTAAVVFTGDNTPTGLVVRLQEQTRRTRKLAAQWAHDLAEVELDKVGRVYAELEKAGQPLPDGQKLLDNARSRLQTCARLWNDADYGEAYAEAQRVLRPLRILMRAEWEKALRETGLGAPLDVPVASPYAVSFFTLPRHWAFLEQVRQGKPAGNLLPGGDFELDPAQPSEMWQRQEPVSLDDVVTEARRVAEGAKEGRQCLRLQIKPKNPQEPPPVLERTFLAINSPAVRLQPGRPVRISGWVHIPQAITASADGALLYDSAGGEPLAVRLTGVTPWKKFTLYRQVPESGTIFVTLALTGLGTVCFDDVRVEPLVWNGAVPATEKR